MRTALVLALIAVVSSLPFYSFAQGDVTVKKSKAAYTVAPDKGSFVLYAGPKGETLCRQATASEARAINRPSNGLRQINHLKDDLSPAGPNGLTIVLRGTAQLDAPENAQAKQAFINAAAKWEALIKNQINIVIDVDFGTTFFGTPFTGPNVIGATSSVQFLSQGNYPDVRTRLINRATSSADALASALPVNSVPVDRAPGTVDTVLVASPLMRVFGIFSADYVNDPESRPQPKIGFNSAFGFDFNPNDGIASNQTDFDAVAVHEIGHVLGFNSDVGDQELTPAEPLELTVWDLFRFRPGTATNASTFGTANRILSTGGTQVQFIGGPELGLSTGNPLGDGGDEEQASHWKDDRFGGGFIGIMDPTIARGVRETMTANDQNAIDAFGYTLTAITGPPNDNFVNAQSLSGSSGTVSGTNVFATRETGEPSNPPSTGGAASVWYNWTATGTGQATFDTNGSVYDTLLAVYTGTSVNALTHIVSNDDISPIDDPEPPPRNIQSRVTFNVTAGTTYRIQVDGFEGDNGSITLNWTAPGSTPSANTVQFSASTANVTEALNATAKVDLTVTRTGTTTGAATVNYATADGTASERSDYLAALGTLRFAANETSKTITVFVVNDSFGESPETFNITLSTPVGCTIGTPAAAVVTINSDEPVSGTHGPNPVKDPNFSSDIFVRQQYADFFNREADTGGLNFWKNQIDECADQACRNIRRVNVSAAFFVSGEFQETGYLVYKAYQAAFSSGEFLRLRDFLPDLQEIGRGVVVGQPGADALLEANKVAFFNDFVQRAAFVAPTAYPATMTAEQFVDKLNANTFDPQNSGSGGALTPAQRDALVAQLAPNPSSPALRAQVLRSISQNSLFSTRQFNKAFVLMQYFGYLRRNPNDSPDADFGGYNFWLGKLNSFGGNYITAQMVEAFITSGEYKLRFGPD